MMKNQRVTVKGSWGDKGIHVTTQDLTVNQMVVLIDRIAVTVHVEDQSDNQYGRSVRENTFAVYPEAKQNPDQKRYKATNPRLPSHT